MGVNALCGEDAHPESTNATADTSAPAMAAQRLRNRGRIARP